MILELLRLGHGLDSTIGALYLDGKLFCFTVEDEWRAEKVAGETRIPSGTYDIKLRCEGGMLPKYQARFPDMDHPGMIHLQDVPGFSYVYIHIGNTEAHSEGCILVNDGVIVDRVDGGGSGSSSKQSYRDLYPQIRNALQSGEEVKIIIRDHVGG